MSKIFHLAFILALSLACQIAPYHPSTPEKPHREFTLEFQFACRKNLKFDSCQGDIFWNGKMIFAVAPEDHQIHSKKLQVFVDSGENTLKFVGTGESDRRGLTIDNVKLVRYGTAENIAVNGDFEQPNLGKIGKKWIVRDQIPGWSGQGIELGLGKLYSKSWKSQVVELDADKNGWLAQQWGFDSDYQLVSKTSDIEETPEMVDKAPVEPEIDSTEPEIAIQPLPQGEHPVLIQTRPAFEPKPAIAVLIPPTADQPKPEILVKAEKKGYELRFQYACRKNIGFSSCQGKVSWNGKEVASVVPGDHKVHWKNIQVDSVAGENTLRFEGAGESDGFGLTIDNVRLVKTGTTKNIVVNGDFQKPNVGRSWKIVDEIPGWKGKGIEVGSGRIYNSGWKTQVIELDGKKN